MSYQGQQLIDRPRIEVEVSGGLEAICYQYPEQSICSRPRWHSYRRRSANLHNQTLAATLSWRGISSQLVCASPCGRDASKEEILSGAWRALGHIHNTTAME